MTATEVSEKAFSAVFRFPTYLILVSNYMYSIVYIKVMSYVPNHSDNFKYYVMLLERIGIFS